MCLYGRFVYKHHLYRYNTLHCTLRYAIMSSLSSVRSASLPSASIKGKQPAALVRPARVTRSQSQALSGTAAAAGAAIPQIWDKPIEAQQLELNFQELRAQFAVQQQRMDEIQAVLTNLTSMVSTVMRQPTPAPARVEVVSPALPATIEVAAASGGSQQDAETWAHYRIKGSTKKAALQYHIKEVGDLSPATSSEFRSKSFILSTSDCRS